MYFMPIRLDFYKLINEYIHAILSSAPCTYQQPKGHGSSNVAELSDGKAQSLAEDILNRPFDPIK